MRYELRHKGARRWWVYDENEEVVTKLLGTKEEAAKLYEEWLRAPRTTPSAVPVPTATPKADAVTSKGVPPRAKSKLSGAELTAALNEGVDGTITPNEWKLQTGVFNESNEVKNVPFGWRAIWATPRHVDGGRHMSWLLARGCRAVYREEITEDQLSSDSMYVNYLDESEEVFVEQMGSRLMIGRIDKLDKLRELEYAQRMKAIERDERDTRNQRAAELGEQPISVQRTSESYNPMNEA